LGDDRPAREPDIVVLLNENLERAQANHIQGPADLVIEIVSPESHNRDRGTKLYEYEAAGVREYWLIDYRRREVVCYKLDAAGIYHPTPLDANGRLVSSALPGLPSIRSGCGVIPAHAATR
jgi:Uma2 family endonuclease